MPQTILITGGTGLVGSRITELLLKTGNQVRYLSRTPGTKQHGITAYAWDVEKQTIDEEAFKGVDSIIHLAGAGVADKKWTPQRKKEILESRTASTSLLRNTLNSIDHHVKTFVSASAIGYYGWNSGGVWKKEESRFGDDFLATVTKAWEEEADQIGALGLRVVKLRIGIVLSTEGGALAELIKPIKLGVGAPLGGGDQYMSWIHVDDLANMFIHAAEHAELEGVYNAVAPNPETNEVVTKTAAEVLNKPCFMPNVPGFVIKLMLGQRAAMVLGGSRVSADKIMSSGFNFQYPDLEPALQDLLR